MNFSVRKKTVTRRLDFETCGDTDEKKLSLENEHEKCDRKSEELQLIAGDIEEKTKPNSESNSPILFWKSSSPKKTKKTSSPVMITTKRATIKSPIFRTKKKKKRRKEEKVTTSTSSYTNSTSPILTCKNMIKRKKTKTAQLVNERLEKNEARVRSPLNCSIPKKITTSLVFSGNSTFENLNEKEKKIKYPEIPLFRGSCQNISDFEESGKSLELGDIGDSYEIEDFSEESPKESLDFATQNTKISNFSSDSKTYFVTNISEGHSGETSLSAGDDFETYKSLSRNESEMESTSLELLDSGRKKKRFKKGSLVERLDNLKKRLASEKRIREHKKKVMKAKQNWKKTLFVLDLWEDMARLMLRCQEIGVGEGSAINVALSESLYVILDRESGIDFKKIKEGTVLRIAPPWQEMQLQKFGTSVLLSLTSLELIDKIHDTRPQIGLRKGAITKYKEDEASLFDTLLNSETEVFLHE